MIPTRIHGVVDYSVAALFGALAAAGPFGPRVRWVLGGAGAFHAGYSAITDYEGGAAALVTMRQHLALDAAGGAALVAIGLAMRDARAQDRAFLALAGLAEFAVVALSDSQPRSGPGQGSGPLARLAGTERDPARTGYPPLDAPKPVADGVWVVDAEPLHALGLPLPVRMTVFRLASGDLLLHSPTRFSLGLKHQLEREGRIRYLVAPNIAHWMFLRDWQRACPDAETFAAPGLRHRSSVQRSGVRLDHDLSADAPPAWAAEIEQVAVPGSLNFQEIAFFHRSSRTLVLTDLVLNLEPEKLPALVRSVARLIGVTAPDGRAPVYLRRIVAGRRPQASAAAARLVALQPERVIFSHGRWFDRNATAELRRSLRWLLPDGTATMRRDHAR